MQAPVCLITGANSGIGKATAFGLARLGFKVVTVCRDTGRGEAARADIIQRSGTPDVDLLIADLASQASVRSLAATVQKNYPRLDILINNAGVAKAERTLSEDGLELTFAVNHLAPFLLTNLLLPTLKASAPARVINVSSVVHRWAYLDFDDLQGEKRYRMDAAYNQSKLANVLFTFELTRRLRGTGVTVNSLEPGMWVALRRHVANAVWWIPANALAWAFGMVIIFAGIDLMMASTHVTAQIALGISTLTLTGASVGAVHGIALIWLVRRQK